MATSPAQSKATGNTRATLVQWAGLAASGDDGQVYPCFQIALADRSVQVEGTFGGATVLIEGSLDGANFRTLTDALGSPLSFTAAGLKYITEPVAYVRPRLTAGAGASLTVTMFFGGQR